MSKSIQKELIKNLKLDGFDFLIKKINNEFKRYLSYYA